MRKISFITLLGLIVSVTAFTQKIDVSKVPVSVKESFARQFPGITAKWEKEEGNYEADFKQDGHEVSVVFDNNGTMLESEIEISLAALPTAAKEYIKNNYNGASIREVAKITLAGGKIEYEAEIKGKDLIFDRSGNFIKEVAR